MAPWVLPALGGLLLLALLVIFWLPERVADPTAEPASTAEVNGPADADGQASPGQAGAPAAKSPSGPDTSPWSDAQLAKLRKEAQDVLAELLDVQFALEERGVKLWAPERFAAVAGLAAAGDELYRSRDYVAAKAQYEEGLGALQALQQDQPQELARQLARAGEALEAGDIAAASGALDTAAAIDPDSAELAGLRQRVEVLPQLLPLLEQAAAAEQAGELAQAIALLEQAVALDPEHRGSEETLQRLRVAYQQQRFNQAMSEGYAALDGKRFEAARKAFGGAAKLQPGSSEAASALQEVAAAATAYRLAGLKTSGLADERAERWQAAVEAYEQAQKIDPNVLFAAEGLARSRDRARLDKQFSAAIEQPQRLADEKVAAATELLLQQAQKITPRGPLLARQLETLQRLLQAANTPVAVTLRSDAQTEVVVYKVARLGQFDQRVLDLRPGKYTAVGSRLGYRDVRVEFSVEAGGAPPPVTIICTESI
jgi:tetratricopeptide (TPR) repeat protein